MFLSIGSSRLELVQGNITEQEIDAIVNAANSGLRGGGGVDGAIHRAAGPILKQQTASRYPEGCPTGSAVVTDAGNLATRYVFHAVGPVWRGGGSGESELLAAVHRRCLELALEHECEGVAFPAISTGAYGYPKELAAATACGTVHKFVSTHDRPALVRFVLFDSPTFEAYAAALERLRG